MLIKRIYNFIDNSSTIGLKNALNLAWNSSICKKKDCFISLPNCPIPIQVRSSTSDVIVLKQLLPLLRNWQPKTSNIKVFVDAGANIGLFTVIIASHYPQSRVIAIEPDPENFKILAKNCEPYKNVEVLQTALWYKKEPLKISNPEASHWERKVDSDQEDNENVIDAVTVSSLIQDLNLEEISLLKLDIEGAEKFIFQYDDLNWIFKVRELLIEFHEGAEIDFERRLANDYKKYSYQREELGEYAWLYSL